MCIYIDIANDLLKNIVYNIKVALIYHIHSAHDEKPFGVHHLPTSPQKGKELPRMSCSPPAR